MSDADRIRTLETACLDLRRALDRCEEGTLDLEAQAREVCARVCDNQSRMLDAAGDRDGATAARLCASVLRALTPPVSMPSSDVPKSEVLAQTPPAVCPAPTEGP